MRHFWGYFNWSRSVSFFLIAGILISQNFVLVTPAHAATTTYDLTTAGDYTYNSDDVEFTAGLAQLKGSINWYSANWTYRKKITIDHTKVAGDLTDFPVLVSLTASDLDFSKTREDGYDIRFADSDGTTLLTFERERHDTANSVAEYWVKLPSVSSSVDTNFYIYYNTPTLTYTHVYETTRSEAFLDTTKIDANNGLTYQVIRPTKYDPGNPDYIFGSTSTDTWDYAKSYVTVLSDTSWPSASRYRMWYPIYVDSQYMSCYAESSDGLTFTKPTLNQVTYDGNTNNNIFSVDNVDNASGQILSVVYDASSTQYVALRGTKLNEAQTAWTTSIEIFTSSNPTSSWTLQKSLPTTYPDNSTGIGHGMGLVKDKDNRWIAYYQYYNGSTRSIGAYRSDTTSLSGTWTDMGILESIAAPNQRHGISVIKDGELFYSIAEDYDDSPVSSGPFILGISRYGYTTVTEKDINWLDRGSAGTWDDAFVLNGSLLKVGDEWYFYYIGRGTPTQPFDGNVGLAKIGYHRIGGVTGTGSLITTAITPSAKLYLNATTTNKIEVELLHHLTNTPITGYTQADFDDITADTTSTEATWGGLSIPTDQSVKLKFYLTSSTLYHYNIGTVYDLALDTPSNTLTDGSSSTTWPSSFKMVQHLEEANEAALVTDSTTNNATGTRSGTTLPTQTTAGKIGRGLSFNGTTAYVTFGDRTLYDGSTALTMSAWVKSAAAANQIIFGKAYVANAGYLKIPSASSYKGQFYVHNGTTEKNVLSNSAINNGAWHYVVGTWDGSIVKIYVDGVLQTATSSLSGGSIPNTTDHLSLGANVAANGSKAGYLNGSLDEVRIANTARSAEWITTEYNNQSSTSTFYSLGLEDTDGETVYDTNNPTITPTTAQTFTSLSGFVASSTLNGGEIKYQISNDNGSTWYWYNSGWTQTSTGYTEANTAADINTNIATFPMGSGQFLWRAYLHSDGTQLVQLDSVAVDYAIDASAPTVSLTAPTEGAVVASAAVTVSANASDETAVAGVQFKLDTNTLIGSEDTSAPYSITWDSTAHADGAHTLIAVARDAAGNYATSTVVNVTIDNTNPTISVTAPTEGAVVADTAVTVTASASDGVAVAGVQFKLDTNTLIGSEDTSAPYSISWNSTAHADGAHTIIAVARDTAGNYATSTAINITIDNTDPTVSLTAPAEGATVDGASVTVSASASDNNSVAGVQFKLDTNTLIGSEDTSAPYSITWDSTAHADGAHTLIAVARDAAGNYATSTVVNVTIENNDTTAPTAGTVAFSSVDITSLVASSTGASDETALAALPYQYRNVTSNTYSGATSTSWLVTGLSGSTSYTFEIGVVDSSGNWATTTTAATTTLAAPIIDSTAPVRSGGSPSGAQTAGTTEVTLSLTTDETATCKYGTTANTAYASIANTFTTTNDTTHSQTITGLSAGSYSYYIRCTDGSSNANTTDYTISFSITATPVAEPEDPGSISGGYYLAPATIQAQTTQTEKQQLLATLITLLNQLKALAAQAGISVDTTIAETLLANSQTNNSPSRFTQPLYLGLNHPEVRLLQQVLNQDPTTQVSTTGPGSPGQETTYFGVLTKQAVQSFQLKYQITTPDDSAYGYVGPKTRERLNELLSQ